MRHLSESTSRVTKSNFSSKYIALGRIVDGWTDIIGEAMVAHAQPVRLNTRTPKNRRTKPDCILDIACSSSHAIVLQYQKPLILERMATIFGNRWVTDIKFIPARALPPRPKRVMHYPKRALHSQDHEFIDETLAHIDDDCIKQRLERMGRHILQESESE